LHFRSLEKGKIMTQFGIGQAHMEFAASESAALATDGTWFRWIARAEKVYGRELDGDQVTDGYSMDSAYEAYESGMTADAYVSRLPHGSHTVGVNAKGVRFCHRCNIVLTD
jgi:hypothetical protein